MTVQFSPPDISELEIERVTEVLRSGWITTGPKVKEFERKIAAFCGVNRAVCLNSQTACAELALRLLDVGPGDEVITSAYTYTASASVICHVGAKPVLVDIQAERPEMDYEKLENAITDRTKAIIPVDIAGIPCDYERIYEVVKKCVLVFGPRDRFKRRWAGLQFLRIRLILSGRGGRENPREASRIFPRFLSMP